MPGLMVDGVDGWYRPMARQLASADLCLPVLTIIYADRRNKILTWGAGGGKEKGTRTFGDVDFHLCGQQ